MKQIGHVHLRMKKRILFSLEIILLHVPVIWFMYGFFSGIGDHLFSGDFNMRDGSIYYMLVYTIIINQAVFFGNVFWRIPNYLTKLNFKYYLIRLVAFLVTLILLKYLCDALLYEAK